MKRANQAGPKTLGLFERRFEGDDALMNLARRRFEQSWMGAEIHASTTDQLNWFLRMRPWPEAPVVLHLPRDFNLLNQVDRSRILALASAGAGNVIGCVLHDQREMVERQADYITAVEQLDSELACIDNCPLLFIEYAVGLEPAEFIGFFMRVTDLDRIAPCIDIGHVGIRAARVSYAQKHSGQDVCGLNVQSPELPNLMREVDVAVASGFASVLELVKAITSLNRPVHFHLHDGHPLSRISPFGVADHLSFFSQIPLAFEYHGKQTVSPMFGPAGLEKIIAEASSSRDASRFSFTLEIHPTGASLALEDDAPLFSHWTDKTNAKRMNHWVSMLTRNHGLLLQTIETARFGSSSQG